MSPRKIKNPPHFLISILILILLLIVILPARAEINVTATLSITNLTQTTNGSGAYLTLKGQNIVWTNSTVASLLLQPRLVASTNATDKAATNLYTKLRSTYGTSGQNGLFFGYGSSTSLVIRAANTNYLPASVNTNWGFLTFTTNQIATTNMTGSFAASNIIANVITLSGVARSTWPVGGGSGGGTNAFTEWVDGDSGTVGKIKIATNHLYFTDASGANTLRLSTNASAGVHILNLRSTNGINYGSAFRSAGSGSASEQFGTDADASGDSSIAIGNQTGASSSGAVSVGPEAQATGVDAIAIGSQTFATAWDASALGAGSIATKDSSTALGALSSATHTNSTALGGGSATTKANQVVIGTAGRVITIPGYAEAFSADGASFTNLANASAVVAGANITVSTNSVAGTGQKLYTVSSTAGTSLWWTNPAAASSVSNAYHVKATSFTGDGSGLTGVPGSTAYWYTNPAAAASVSNAYLSKTATLTATAVYAPTVGTTNAADLILISRGTNALALLMDAGGDQSPNVRVGTNTISVLGANSILGGFDNTISEIVSTIAGGGGNEIVGTGGYNFLGGGRNNSLAASSFNSMTGGDRNTMTGYNQGSVIAGGFSNSMTFTAGVIFYDAIGQSVISGGHGNQIVGVTTNSNFTGYQVIAGGAVNYIFDQLYGGQTISGGKSNSAFAGDSSVIGGGLSNTVSGYYPTVPGGSYNTASGSNSLAAGTLATASHSSTFVWNDAVGSFASSGANQFLISASGGVGINTNNPGSFALSVHGNAYVNGVITGDGSGLTSLPATNLVWYPNTFPSATNTLTLNNGDVTLVTATDVSITNLAGVTAGQSKWTTLQVSNSAATAITVRMLVGATVRAQGTGTTNGLVLGAAKMGFLSFKALGATNYWTTAEP